MGFGGGGVRVLGFREFGASKRFGGLVGGHIGQ